VGKPLTGTSKVELNEVQRTACAVVWVELHCTFAIIESESLLHIKAYKTLLCTTVVPAAVQRLKSQSLCGEAV